MDIDFRSFAFGLVCGVVGAVYVFAFIDWAFSVEDRLDALCGNGCGNDAETVMSENG
jgi:hypothetical protein